MRCYFHTTTDGTRVLIPGCWGVVHNYHLPDHEALQFCHCPPRNRKEPEQIIDEMKERIRALEAKVKQLEQGKKPE